MAAMRFVFIFLCSCIYVNSEVGPVNISNNVETYDAQVAAVLNYLNSSPVKVYNYRQGTVLNAKYYDKANITELTLDVNVECINTYPNLPCTEVLICNAFVQNSPGEGSQVLNDVKCKPKPEIIIEEPPATTVTKVENNGSNSIELSNEAVSSEVGEPFVAVKRDSWMWCLGCPVNLNLDAQGVDELVALALEHLETERPNKQVLVKVLKVQQQVALGVEYTLLIEVGPSVCSKDADFDRKSCPRDSNAETSVCRVTYLHRSWLSKTKRITGNNCTVSQEFGRSDSIKDTRNNEVKGAREMLPSGLTDLESQIIVEDGATSVPTQRTMSVDSLRVPDTPQTQISAVENRPLEDRPTDTESADPSESPVESTTNEQQIADDFVSAYYGSVYSEDFPQNLRNETTTEEPGDEASRSKRESDVSLEDVELFQESGEVERGKRAVRQLEKISPEEKGLVKNLADFAAAALDSIDDDNHKRIILQILGAKKMVGDDGVYYHIIMRMGISRCLEDNPPNPNENCREKLFENYTKICKVQVYVNDDFISPKIVKSQCQNIKKDKNDSNRTNYSRFRRAVRVGGQQEFDKNSEKIGRLLRQGVEHLNVQSKENNKYKPVEVISATSQVVAGVIYRIKTKLSLTDCSKNDEKAFEDCGVLEGASPKICELQVWEKSWLKFRQIKITCEGDDKEYKFETETDDERRKRSVPGGEAEAPEDDEYIVRYLEDGLRHLDAEGSHENKLKIHEFISATEQIVAGHIYRIKVKVVLSDCKKSDSTNRGQCGALEGARPKICNFVVFEQPWVAKSRETNITCEDDAKEHFFREKRSADDFQGPRLLGRDDATAHFLMFHDFIKKYNRSYSSKKEYKYRLRVFSDNMKFVRVLNAYERGTATYGVTRFADMTGKEFSKSLGLRPDLRNENETPFARAQIPDLELPTEFDWRTKGVVTEVKNQEQCGSCWAFSVTGNVEGQYALKYGKLLEFSEQELVDCDGDDQGCNGGLMDTAYRAIEKIGGLETEQDYPYDAEDEKCHFNRSLARVQLSGALNISHNETDMAKWLVANGPISIAINANAMQFYMGGVSHPFKFLCNPNNLDHGVLIVGYGVHTYPLFKKTLPYWIVKNSWGTSWGEQGYYRVYRGDGTCGLNQTPSSAIVA